MTGRSFVIMGLFHLFAGVILAVFEPSEPLLFASQFVGGLFEIFVGLLLNHFNREVIQ